MHPTLTLLFTFRAAGTAFAGKPGSCVNPSLQWTIGPNYIDGTTNAVQSDGATYIDGQPGVSAVVHVCSGTYDAILLLSKGRTFSTSFAKLLASNPNTPSWALNGTTQTETTSTIHNLFFVPSGTDRNQEYSFTTRGGAGFSMVNPAPQAPFRAEPRGDREHAIPRFPLNCSITARPIPNFHLSQHHSRDLVRLSRSQPDGQWRRTDGPADHPGGHADRFLTWSRT